MSQLNLTPDPVVLGAQAAIFLANMFVVKNLILEPYLSVRARREASTGGSQEAAAKLVSEAKALETKITERMREAHREAAVRRDQIKSDATAKRAVMLKDAEQFCKQEQQKIEKDIAANLEEERARKDATIKSLAQSFFSQVVQ
jgi:F0F1-type ATP synthase membrane subunit b/b'